MSSTSRSHRVVVNQSSTAVYTRLANDSSASIEESTQISRSQNGNPDNGKYGPVRENTLCQDEEDEEDEEDEDDEDEDYDEEEERRQDGVRQAEAITSVWTFRALVFTYFLYVNFSQALGGFEWGEMLTEVVSSLYHLPTRYSSRSPAAWGLMLPRASSNTPYTPRRKPCLVSSPDAQNSQLRKSSIFGGEWRGLCS